ncbi:MULTISPECIES: CD225/dispanin family protein [unclassified Pseudoxanthomonas]|uniref:CD225/dispanin family protein n=1 Tax=unclassified Pseudoxanthomonas TaxID=2645906 RepID=UPI0008E5BE5B|nr:MULTISPECIES: CD225/dispanin family protein [unclassified Pseudoxanthomonas]PPJ44172.1 hypothetical protein C0063_07470 [Pseudoxanthomonas sp. KAs_5_3]SFV34052.1 Interferon-induced transmembrane protein [Pseudoxanthomonas sp. YR558]
MSSIPPVTPPPVIEGAPIPSYLAWSITSTVLAFLLCCIVCYSFPGIVTGVVAIVFSTKVGTLLRQGDLDGARAASKNAKIWTWVTAGIIGAAVILFFVSLALMGGVEGYMERIQEFQQQIEANQ